jgi:hypothetical protein
MARPTFSLSDDEARRLVSELADIEKRCPFSPRDHRQFVREFIKSIYGITGKAFSPTIYRRILAAYAPARRPSTATLALEKERFVKQLEQRSESITVPVGEPIPSDALLWEIRELLGDLVLRTATRGGGSTDSYLQAQCDFLQRHLSQSEQQLAEAKGIASAADAHRQVLEAQLSDARGQIASLQSTGAAMHEQLGNLSRSIDEARQFALLAIDDARGETRAWRERFQATEHQLNAQVSITETFRRLAYRQGADVPPALQQTGKP